MMPIIRKMQKKLVRFMPRKSMQKRNLVEPARDWLIGLFILTTLFVCGAVYVVIDFYTQVDFSYESIQVSVEAVSYPERDVLYYSEQYEQKEVLFNELRGIMYESTIGSNGDEAPLAEDLVAQ